MTGSENAASTKPILAHGRAPLLDRSTGANTLESDARPASPRASAVIATLVGNTLEWFDFAVYAFFAVVIARTFFPSGDPVVALMSTFAAFGVGFGARPLGAWYFGRMGDGQGRKLALLISMPMMGVGTLIVGATPSFASIGFVAPVLLVLGRLMQGFAAGGETGNAMTFLAEWAPDNRRGLYASLQQGSALLGTLLGSGCAALLTSVFAQPELDAWGWRLPFLFGGLVVAPLGLFLRRHVNESPVFDEAEHKPVKTHHGGASQHSAFRIGLKVLALSAAWVSSFYVYLIYLPTFLTSHGGMSPDLALWANTLGLAAMMFSIPLWGLLSDFVGRKPPLLLGALATILVPFPLFQFLVPAPSILVICLIMVGAGLLTGLFAGIMPANMSEHFPTELRTTGVSVSFGLATAIFGGFAPFICTGLIKAMGNPTAPYLYLVAVGVVSLVALLSTQETAFKSLR